MKLAIFGLSGDLFLGERARHVLACAVPGDGAPGFPGHVLRTRPAVLSRPPRPGRAARPRRGALPRLGGPSLEALTRELGAKRAVPLYGCIDPGDYPLQSRPADVALTYLGTYAQDREEAFGRLLLAAARAAPLPPWSSASSRPPAEEK